MGKIITPLGHLAKIITFHKIGKNDGKLMKSALKCRPRAPYQLEPISSQILYKV